MSIRKWRAVIAALKVGGFIKAEGIGVARFSHNVYLVWQGEKELYRSPGNQPLNAAISSAARAARKVQDAELPCADCKRAPRVFSSYCRECWNARTAGYMAARRQRIAQGETMPAPPAQRRISKFQAEKRTAFTRILEGVKQAS